MRRAVRFCSLSLVVLLAVGCSSSIPENASEQRAPQVVGTNDLVPVAADGANVPEKYRQTLDAFGMMEFDAGRNHCTVTHVGGGVVITAGHCFDAPAARTDDVTCPDGYSIVWGYRVDHPAYLTSSCDRVLAMQHTGDIDYAIVRVSPMPPAAVRPNLSMHPKLGAAITVFSHPAHLPLEWSQTCTVEPVTATDGGAAGRNEFRHECDTEPASSGAAVLDDATLEVVGIHDGAWHGANYATYLADTPLAEFLGPL